MKKTYSVNMDNIPDNMKAVCKPEMTKEDVAMLGNVIMRMKWENFKNKCFGWYYERKTRKQR